MNSIIVQKFRNQPLTRVIASIFQKKQNKSSTTEDQPNQSKSLPDANLDRSHEDIQPSPKSMSCTSLDAAESEHSYTIDNRFLDTFQKEENTEIFVIYLNQSFNPETLASLMSIATYTIMADGAANRFYENFNDKLGNGEILPSALVGDFDSINKDVMEYYKDKKVEVFNDESQDDTDLEKCLKHLQKKFLAENLYQKGKNFKILITGGFGGRLDHTLNNIHVVHKFADKYIKQKNVSIHLMDNNSIGTCILPGKTRYIRAKEFELSKGCGIFPLMGEKAHVNTTGLKWNLEEKVPISFKSFVSSSNEMVDDVIEFETDSIVFWTTTSKLNLKEN